MLGARGEDTSLFLVPVLPRSSSPCSRAGTGSWTLRVRVSHDAEPADETVLLMTAHVVNRFVGLLPGSLPGGQDITPVGLPIVGGAFVPRDL